MNDKVSACDELCAEIRSSGVAPDAACGFFADGDFVVGGATEALFDLASVTKPMFAVAFARSGLDRTAKLGAMLEPARGTAAEEVPLDLLFAHRAGFPAHLELWKETGDRVAIACRSRTPGPLPAAPLYSDIGYMLAGCACRGPDVSGFVERHLIAPLGLSEELGAARSFADIERRAPPTEGGLRGRVHDENARALADDGVCGHAGLFGTARAVLRFGAHVLDNLEKYDWLIRPREGGTLRAGFDGRSPEGSSAGSVLGPRSFGHLGFTGTSLWIDPDARIAVALLTNRVCPSRENTRIREARPRVHDALARLALDLRLFRR